jgi:hypothetical protein
MSGARRARLTVRVTPRAARDDLTLANGAITAHVTAPPHDGKANAAAARLLAAALGVPRSRVRLVGGARSRVKTFAIEGVDAGEALKALEEGAIP